MKEPKLLRILDANFNRTMEGLRVSEDIARFILDDASLTKTLKEIRHEVLAATRTFKLSNLRIARDIEGDVGMTSIRSEFKRKKINDIFFANIQRAKESIRVLEEFGKLSAPSVAARFKALRYKLYALEKKAALRF